MSPAAVLQILRKRRSDAYMKAIMGLDAGTHHSNKQALQDLTAQITAEFPELGVEELPIGIVSRCYLGAPYVVHVCDLLGTIVEHFQSNRAMPAPFERARSLALHSAYEFIEIYPGSLRAVARDGSVSVIDR